MKIKITSTIIMISALLACTNPDYSSHVSYGELDRFLMSKSVREKFNPKKTNVSGFHLADSTNIEFGRKTYRKLIATYEFTLINDQKEYFSKAVVTSNDSINWQLTQLKIVDKSATDKTKTEHAYIWDFTKSNEHSDLITIVTEE